MPKEESVERSDTNQELSQETVNEILENPESKKLEELNAEQLRHMVRVTARASYFSGPLPDPETLKKYEEAMPGTVDRIIKMAEEQAKHRQEIEKAEVNTESRDSMLGILSALFMGLGILVAGTLIAIFAKNPAAAWIGGFLDLAGIATIIGTFLKETSTSWKNKNE